MCVELLNRYSKNVKSQDGEDGIIEHIFQVIGVTNKICVEFGAWDGEHLSNTWNLIVNHQWKAVLIEANPYKVNVLKEKFKNHPYVKPICALVEESGPNSIDSILSQLLKVKRIDLMSIDIDGNDYKVWESIVDYHPRVVIVEYNPTIPSHMDLRAVNPDNFFGCSIRSLYNLGKKKGYELVACTLCNGIFVEKELYPKFNLETNDPDILTPKKALTWVISTYDGQLLLSRVPPYSAGRDIDEFYEWVCAKEKEEFPDLSQKPRKDSVNQLTEENLEHKLQRIKIR